MGRATKIADIIKGLGVKEITFLEAFVISTNPLTLRSTTDNGLIISHNNLLPLAERFSCVEKNAVIYKGDETENVIIEIDNSIKVDDLYFLLQFNLGDTCKYYILDKI